MKESDFPVYSQRLDAIVESAHDGIIAININRQITFMNMAACKMFGYDSYHQRPRDLDALIPAKFRHRHDVYVEEFRVSQSLSRSMQSRLTVEGLRRDSTVFPLEISISKIAVAGSVEMVAVVRDVSDRSKLMQELTEAASLDHLTGLANKRVFNEELARQVSTANRYQRSLCLIVCDLDHFKRVNDNYGHSSGDQVLKKVAQAISESIRDVDVAARWGGEEFAILLPETKLDGAVTQAERIKDTIQACTFWFDDTEVRVSASFGVVEMSNKEQNVGDLFDHADKLLYRAKRAGRNCVVV